MTRAVGAAIAPAPPAPTGERAGTATRAELTRADVVRREAEAEQSGGARA